MDIKYLCPYWGQENLGAALFIDKVVQAKYNGIEINFPALADFKIETSKKLQSIRDQDPSFIFVAQSVPTVAFKDVDECIANTEKQLLQLATLNPNFINAHTGKDFFSFDDNCRVIESTLNISNKTGVRIVHETHRGRFSFHLATLVRYLEKFPELELTGDFSHFCVVSESLLEDQENLLRQIIPHIVHLHARVGSSQAPQVNNPMAPEWAETLNCYTQWWRSVIDYRTKKGDSLFTVTPEFGPAPYMPTLPFSQQPIADQWACNLFMTSHLYNAL